MNDDNLKNKRAALYVRVSTEEQAIKGYSLDAQIQDLTSFAKKHFMVVVDNYVDAGITARKKLNKRKDFQRMLEDVKNDKIDIILFIKLDRWFRNVSDYYEVQKILDKHNVSWKCTHEFYDTTTANGRLNLNIKLSIAQDEADRTSERIKFVQANKVKNGEVITGSMPYGLMVANENGKKIVKVNNDEIHVVLDAFKHYVHYNSRRKTRFYIENKYGITWTDVTFKSMIFNNLYAGQYRDNTNYCESVVSMDFMEQMRRISKTLHQHSRSGVHCYIFAGLIRCGTCKNKMHGVSDKKKNGYTFYYRCSKHYNNHACSNIACTRETFIEDYLLSHIEHEIQQHILSYEMKEKVYSKTKSDKSKIKAKMKKLKDLYVNDLIDMTDYKKDYEMYLRQLNELTEMPSSEATVENLKAFLQRNFRNNDASVSTVYNDLGREDKRYLWRSIIKEIYISPSKEITSIIFL